MQMDDLQLDPELDGIDENELLDQVSELLEHNDAADEKQVDDPLKHVTAISQRIELLTQSLRQSEDPCDCHETAARMIDVEAQLARLQQELDRQSGRGARLETGLELLEAFGKQIESLTDHIKLAALDAKSEDYSGNFNDLGDSLNVLAADLQSVQEQLGGLPDYSGEFAKQMEAMGESHRQLDELSQKTIQPEHFQGMEEKLDSIRQSLVSPETLDRLHEKVDSLTGLLVDNDDATLIRQQLNELKESLLDGQPLQELAGKVDSLTDKFAALDRLDNLEQQLQSLSEQVKNAAPFEALENRLNALSETLQSHEGIDGVSKKLESLTDFVKLGALENEPLDASQISEMAEQINAIGQLLVEKGVSADTSGHSSEQFEQLNSKIESLAEIVQLYADRKDSDDGNQPHQELFEKLEAISSRLESQNTASPAWDGELPDYRDQIQQLTDKLDQTQATVDSLVSSLLPLMENLKHANDGGDGVSAADSSSWEQQKKALMAGYESGEPVDLDSEDNPLEQHASPISDSEDQDDAEANPQLEEMKAELEEKLRKAEIEISIERAKIHQERRELEEMQSELDRKQARIDTQKSDDSIDSEGEAGGGRWSRFLGSSRIPREWAGIGLVSRPRILLFQ